MSPSCSPMPTRPREVRRTRHHQRRGLGHTPRAVSGNASATKNGNSYKVTGTATGTSADLANPTPPVNKPFEINVTCTS